MRFYLLLLTRTKIIFSKSISMKLSNTHKFIALAVLLGLGFFFLINSEYASASADTVQKVLAALFFAGFIGGIFYATKSK